MRKPTENDRRGSRAESHCACPPTGEGLRVTLNLLYFGHPALTASFPIRGAAQECCQPLKVLKNKNVFTGFIFYAIFMSSWISVFLNEFQIDFFLNESWWTKLLILFNNHGCLMKVRMESGETFLAEHNLEEHFIMDSFLRVPIWTFQLFQK